MSTWNGLDTYWLEDGARVSWDAVSLGGSSEYPSDQVYPPVTELISNYMPLFDSSAAVYLERKTESGTLPGLPAPLGGVVWDEHAPPSLQDHRHATSFTFTPPFPLDTASPAPAQPDHNNSMQSCFIFHSGGVPHLRYRSWTFRCDLQSVKPRTLDPENKLKWAFYRKVLGKEYKGKRRPYEERVNRVHFAFIMLNKELEEWTKDDRHYLVMSYREAKEYRDETPVEEMHGVASPATAADEATCFGSPLTCQTMLTGSTISSSEPVFTTYLPQDLNFPRDQQFPEDLNDLLDGQPNELFPPMHQLSQLDPQALLDAFKALLEPTASLDGTLYAPSFEQASNARQQFYFSTREEVTPVLADDNLSSYSAHEVVGYPQVRDSESEGWRLEEMLSLLQGQQW